MARIPEKYMPYAFVGNILSTLDRLREVDLPEPLTVSEIVRIGVSEGNASRTIAALQFLGLIDEEGAHTESMKILERVSTDEYPDALAEVIRAAYRDIFKIIDLSNVTTIKINDAFRGYNPAKQRKRMVNLFMGLCQVAGLISGEPSTSQRHKNSGGESEPIEKKKIGSTTFKKVRGSNADKWFIEFERLLERLPEYENPTWSKDERDKWINAISSQLDYLIEVDE